VDKADPRTALHNEERQLVLPQSGQEIPQLLQKRQAEYLQGHTFWMDVTAKYSRRYGWEFMPPPPQVPISPSVFSTF
jgi:hypothetical protein